MGYMIIKGDMNKEVALILAEKLNCLLIEEINDEILEKVKETLEKKEIVIFLEDVELPYKHFIFELGKDIDTKGKNAEEIADIILHK